MSLDIDERLEQKKLELYKKHGLDGSMSDEEVANKIRSLSSNKVRQQLLNDFKVQLNGLTINGNYQQKNCKQMIDTFLEHRNEGFPRLRCKIMSPAERKADQKAANKALNAKKTAKRAEKRAKEKASIVDNHPTFNTPAFAVPGKDFNVLRHEDDVVTAAALFYFKGSHWREWQYFTLLAYIHVAGRVSNERENEGAVQKLVQLYELSLERRETLMETASKVSEGHVNEYFAWKEQTSNRQIMDRDESQIEWLVTSDVVSLDESRRKISIPWIRTLIGLHLIVPGRWWTRCKKKDKSKLWRCEIDSINDTDKEEKYFGIKCHGDGVRYWIKYETIKMYVDTDHVDYPKYDLPEKQPSIDQELNARCEQTLRRLKDPNGEIASCFWWLVLKYWESNNSFILTLCSRQQKVC